MLLRHTTAKEIDRKALTINPAKTCQPCSKSPAQRAAPNPRSAPVTKAVFNKALTPAAFHQALTPSSARR